MNKYIKQIGIFLTISLVIIACNNITKIERQSLQTDSTSITQSPPETNVVEIWWEKGYNSREDEALQKLITNWEKQTGNKVKLSLRGTDELLPLAERASKAGRLPDIILSFKAERSLSSRFAWEGKLADVSEVIEPIKNLYSPEILNSVYLYNNVEKKRSYYGIPIHQATNNVYYWKDLLDLVGRSDKDIPQDWDGFWEFWTQVQDELRNQHQLDIHGLGLSLSVEAGDTFQTFEQILEAYEVSILDKQGQLQVDKPEVRQGLITVFDWYRQFYDRGYIPPEALNWLSPDNNRSLLNRSVLMTTNHTLSIPGAVRQDPDTFLNKLKIAELPNKPNGKPMRYLVTVEQALVFAEAKNPELAKDFLSYLLEPNRMGEYLKASGGRYAPVLKPIWQDSFWSDSQKEPHVAIATKTMTESPIRTYYTFDNPAYSVVLKENVWGQTFKRMLIDGISTEEAVDETISKIKQIFAEWEE